MQEIVLPRNLSLKETLMVSRRIRDLSDGEEVAINFKDIQHPGPFALLMISSAVRRVKDLKPNIRFSPRYYSEQSYCAHIGFFRSMGFQFGKPPGFASGGENYLPISIQEVVSIRSESRESGRPIGEIVEETARALAEVLSQSRSGEVFDIFTFTLREIIRNTVEHSRSPSIEWCAQYWKDMDRAEIAIIDRGIGIHKSLQKNTTLKIDNERHAINMALLPGISCNVPLGGTHKVTSVWQNSGFGLFMTQSICRHGGDFLLASGSNARFLKDKKSNWFDFGFDGTAVRLVFQPKSIGSLSAALAKFDCEGKEIAKRHNISIPDASTASRMVRLDFRF